MRKKGQAFPLLRGALLAAALLLNCDIRRSAPVLEDGATPDLSRPDLSLPDAPKPDAPRPDAKTPDVFAPDQAPPDLKLPALDGGGPCKLGWKVIPSGTTDELFAVWGSGAKDIYAVGSNGLLARYGCQ